MPKQTTLRNVRILMRDAVWNASFVFPFFDKGLRVRFVLIIADRGSFIIYARPRWAGRGRLKLSEYSNSRPSALSTIHSDLFHRLFHFDPWWTMQYAQDVPSAVRQAVMATNLPARRWGHLVIRDVVFDDNLSQVEEIRIGDGVFRAVSYDRTRPMPGSLREAFFTNTTR